MTDEISLRALHQVALKASDLDVAQQFYRDVLGARILARFDPPGLLFFDFGGTRLLLEGSARPGTVYFRVDKIHDAYEALKGRGVNFTSEPHMIFKDDEGTFGAPGHEEWMAFFEDPDGNILALASRE